MSLTRSYRAPSINNLIGRPRVNFRFPPPAANTATTPDFAGNPALKPELATGIDIAFERYLGAGGVLSANLFYRQVHDLMRGTTELETDLSWAPQRWVNRPKNIGDAITQGLELEAKFRLTELWPEAVPADVRTNLSLFNSRVASVPGPDNRLDSQPNATANLGADYRLRSLPLTLGGNLNWTPAYDTQLSAEQSARQGRKVVFDAYALWAFKPGVQLRLSATNLDPQDYLTGGSLESNGTRESTRSVNTTYTAWQLRLELKL
jgi:iron complex outermembrane receptor protein